MLKSSPVYRAEAFMRGLRTCGYDVRTALPHAIEPRDVLVIWNRYSQFATWADRFEAAGARVLVAENAYVGKGVALALSQHNGAGTWPEGDDSRLNLWPVAPQPWRNPGSHILVLPQRGVGPPGVGMPSNWLARTLKHLKTVTKRPLRVRAHPGQDPTPLEPDLADVWACVTWGSGAAIKALIAGVPAFYEMPKWIGAAAAVQGFDNLEAPTLCRRTHMLRRLTWAQWTFEEIASGEPFKRLLA